MKKLLADFLGIKEGDIDIYTHLDSRANTYLVYYTEVEQLEKEIRELNLQL